MQVKTKTASSNPQGVHPEIRQIEKEIVAFFAQKTELTNRDPIISTVMTYFFIRRNLTQQDLQRLTGFSAGAISNAVRQLVKINIITKCMIPGTHKHIYKMEMLPFRSPRYFLRTEKTLEKLKRELEEMKQTLKTQTDGLQNLGEYKRVDAVVTQLLTLLSGVPVLIDLIEEELKSYLQKSTEHT